MFALTCKLIESQHRICKEGAARALEARHRRTGVSESWRTSANRKSLYFIFRHPLLH